MKRSGWVTGVTVLQFLFALVLLALPLYLLVLTHTAEVRNGPDADEDISGLRIAVAIFIVPALLALAAWYGLWKEKLWGWWLALLDNLAITGVLTYSAVDDGWKNFDWEAVSLSAMFAVLVVFLLSPPVRRFYWEAGLLPSAPRVPAPAVGAERQCSGMKLFSCFLRDSVTLW